MWQLSGRIGCEFSAVDEAGLATMSTATLGRTLHTTSLTVGNKKSRLCRASLQEGGVVQFVRSVAGGALPATDSD
jgi:hypothetical protein